MNLWQHFLNNPGAAIYKWHHYFPVYERHFSPWRNRTLTFWEIGVLQGGSLEMWQQFFGPFARIVGLDIDPACKKCEKDGIHVRIGNQSDRVFLDSVCEEFGVPDIVLDDGSHYMHDLWATFEHIYPKLGKNGVYALEDLQTCYWEEYGGGAEKPDTFINRAKKLVDELNADQSRGAIPPTNFTRSTFSISFYDSLIVFEKGNVWRKEAPVIGAWDDRSAKPPTVSAPMTDICQMNYYSEQKSGCQYNDNVLRKNRVVSHWQLDAPLVDCPVLQKGDEIIVAGWGIAEGNNQCQLRVVIQVGDNKQSLPIEIEREDVIRMILLENPEGHSKRKCGFYYVIPAEEAEGDLQIGFEANGATQTVAKYSLELLEK